MLGQRSKQCADRSGLHTAEPSQEPSGEGWGEDWGGAPMRSGAAAATLLP
jgi:hypothetical protein